MKIALDGRSRGDYRGECECGFAWFGDVTDHVDLLRNPTLPIAEAVVHVRMSHEGHTADVKFSERFERWLELYWRVSSPQLEISNGGVKR